MLRSFVKTFTAFLLLIMASSAIADNHETFILSGLTQDDYKEGTREYLVYFREKETGVVKWLSLWQRKTEIVTIDGEQYVKTTQAWHSDDERFKRRLYSLNRVEDFSPVYHLTEHGNEGATSAFIFTPEEITGDPDVEGNARADFSMESRPETLNWELDMETFALLPLEEGAVFPLNFYHPGASAGPQVYEYSIIGEETLTGIGGNAIPTWMMRINYSETDYAIFWLDKNDGQMLKMYEQFGNLDRFKVKLGVLSDAEIDLSFPVNDMTAAESGR